MLHKTQYSCWIFEDFLISSVHSVNFFFTEMRPLTRDIIVSGIPWDTEKQEIIEHFEVNNFLLGKVDEG